MTTPKFNSEISLGSILQIAVLLIAGTSAFVYTQTGVGANTRHIADIEARVRTAEKEIYTLPVKLNNLASDAYDIKAQLTANNRLILKLFQTGVDDQ